MDEKLEEKLKSEVVKLLEKGRPNWDLLHTLASVYWMKKLIREEGGEEKILVSAMYLHDIGYSGLFTKKYDYDAVAEVQRRHQKVGALKAREILQTLPYTSGEIARITHLVEVHDTLDSLSSKNEIMVMEADTLGQLDRERVASTFSKKDCERFIVYLESERIPRFQTTTGKRYLNQLVAAEKKRIAELP